MTRIFKIHGFVFRVSYDRRFFQKAFRGLESCRARKASGPVLEIKKAGKNFPLPEKALRVHFNSKRQTAEFISGSARYYQRPGLSAGVDHKKIFFKIRYKKTDAETLWHFEQALAWMIKTLAHRRNKIYLPGQAVRCGRRFILVTGHPECGKTACLEALKKEGAMPAAGGLLLDRERLFFFNAGLAAKRGEARKIRKLLKPLLQEIEPPRLERIIIVSGWNERASVLRRLKPEEAVSEFFSLSRRAYEYFSPEQSEVFNKSYREILKKVPCFRFLMGKDRRAASKAMLSF